MERREFIVAQLSFRNAVRDALAQEMRRDERVIVLGEDVAIGGVFKTTAGLLDEFGSRRVWDTPICEQAIAGAAMGAAIAGLRPIAEIMFSDFYATCWDQVVNEIAKTRYMTGGQVTIPLVLRGANGFGSLGFGSQHGQACENWVMTVPGLKIVSPATPAEMKGLLAAAIQDPDPVLVFEHKALYGAVEEVPDGDLVIPLGRARTVRPGRDVTLVGLSITVRTCEEAAERLDAQGISAEVIDLRTLVPLDAQAVLESVARTHRLVIAEENPGQLGWGASLSSIVVEEAFGELAGPPVRVSGGNIPYPVASVLEAEVAVTPDRVVRAVQQVLGISAPTATAVPQPAAIN
ncbi:alpha-ketoacid dehydrogenase subunit beta [Nocardioides marmoriginsengisoli]|uniref:alpha-ketoacid dehydrogenase subunit beta n=1 Tax=Nocardioides marmoriginsengisoli TaxID=661483 RepID=UPI00160DDAF6|nr:pyruvate dehydrogenase complex E1 component subunit beta [Nocardioides marmoriginsengisoli]